MQKLLERGADVHSKEQILGYRPRREEQGLMVYI